MITVDTTHPEGVCRTCDRLAIACIKDGAKHERGILLTEEGCQAKSRTAS